MNQLAKGQSTMQIRTLHVNNFKSLVDFQLDLAKFTCLIGLNGAGKSTVLQFIDFLAQQVQGDLKGWLSQRKWRAKDVKSLLAKKTNVDFSVCLAGDSGETHSWEATFNPKLLHCTSESISVPKAALSVQGGRFSISDSTRTDDVASALLNQPVSFSYQGSILSQLKESALPGPLIEFKQFLQSLKSLDLLSPEYLRQRTPESSGSLGLGGQRLSAFLHELGREKRLQLVRRLQAVYPRLQDLHTRSLQSGWKLLEVAESYEAPGCGFYPRMTTEARHVADGMLRLIAILAAIQTDHHVLLFDEIENGVNPEVVEFVLDALVSAPQQVLVTTHSPLILNYLTDDVARSGVIYLYKTRQGHTRAIPFFSIPSIAEKLTVMGPGEAFADTDLTNLREEIEAVTEGK